MARRNTPRWRALTVGAGVALAFVVITPAAAQSEAPCRPGDSLLSFGKAAFFRSIERGAFAIGERTLDDLLDGLGGAPKPSGGSKRARTTSPSQTRAAALPPGTDTPLVEALSAYVERPSSEAADAALLAFLASATRILFETPPEKPGEFGKMGLVLEEGQLRNRSSTFAVSDMADERKRLDLENSFFGDGPDLQMGMVNKMLNAAPFFKAPVIADAKNLDRNNLGIEVRKELDMRALWFEDYRGHLTAATPSATEAQITEALNAGWPIAQKFWAFKRTEIFILRAQATFGTEMREVNERVTQGNLPLRDCEPKGR